MSKRRLVVCFDGTWNSPDKGVEPTNVVKMVRAIRNHDDLGIFQVTFYDKGVGTAGGTDAIKGGAFGAGLIANIMDGYRFIANNHDPEDEIYIFGFSRGAYTARSLAGVICLAGILSPEDLGGGLRNVISICQDRTIKGLEQKRRKISCLKLSARRDATIQCLGVWDTVGSLGIPGDLGQRIIADGHWFPNLRKHYFPDVELSERVEVALQATAIDEKRAVFAPTLWVSKDGLPARKGQIVEQVWFAGVHSNVGGSYADSRLSDIAFNWMARRVSKLTGLALEESATSDLDSSYVEGTAVESRTLPMYLGSRFYPYQRIINGVVPKGSGFGEWFRRRYPMFDRRNIPPEGLQVVNEALHISVLERCEVPAVRQDWKEGASSNPVLYRPVNLVAAILAHRSGRRLRVVGWNGCPIDGENIPWPQI